MNEGFHSRSRLVREMTFKKDGTPIDRAVIMLD